MMNEDKRIEWLLELQELTDEREQSDACIDSAEREHTRPEVKYEPDTNKFKTWLQQLRDWRNEQSHQAPIATEEEYDAAIHIVTALYLYVTAYNIKWLEPKMLARLVSMNAELEPMPIAAENIENK